MNMKREYLEYVNGEYTEVRNFLKEKEGVVDMDKHRMIFDKLTMPYGSWIETKKAAGEPGKKETLADIIAMYGLIDDHGLLKLKNYMEHGFEDLVDALGAHGYRYNKEKRVFMPPWNGVKK
jgi:hypothetical protein